MNTTIALDADFLDFGCSKGGSIVWARQVFGLQRGVGVDIDPDKVAKTRAAGFDAFNADASALELESDAVSFCVMSHFLEHLPGMRTAEKCIASACRVARDFVYIRHPWFDSDYDLWKMGYKFYWSDWKGHTANIGVAQLDYMLRRVNPISWTLYGRGPITHLSHRSIIPLDAPCDSGFAEAEKPSTQLPFTAYHEVCALIQTGSVDAYDAAKAKLARDHIPLQGA